MNEFKKHIVAYLSWHTYTREKNGESFKQIYFFIFSDCLRSCANPRIARHSLNPPRYKLRFQEMKHAFH
ncbi:hypothetical protein HY25_001050 [Salmonella enterica subsp. enterica]|nr:hypothetical protein [Salmonella enterica subsp. enterica]